MSRATAPSHVAAGDCESCRAGPVAQPANTASSLAYCVAGAWLLRRGRRTERPGGLTAHRALAWAAVAAGLGSVAYHGPGTALGRYLHDASLLAFLGLSALDDLEVVAGATVPPAAVAAVPAAAVVAAHPSLSSVAQIATGAVAAGAGFARALRPGPSDGGEQVAGVVLLAGGGALHLLGRTDGPLCQPRSLLQPHAAWHAATAASIALRHR